MKKYSKLTISILAAVAAAFIPFGAASAGTVLDGANSARCSTCPSDLFGDSGVFRQISNTILLIIGAFAVIMLMWGGLRYVLSGGDSKKVTDAKNTILYAILGLIISFVSFAIINFVISALPSSQNRNQETTQEEEKDEEKKEDSVSCVVNR